MRQNTTKAKLRAGQAVYGCFVRYPDPALVELLAYQSWDFFVFDGEHGTLDPQQGENMVRAAELHGVTPIIRVPTNQQPILLRYMDTGAQGALVPWVNSAAEAEAAVRSIKYYPRGIRGLAGVRAADYGQTVKLNEYVRQANEETLVALQVETAQAVENLSSIIEVADIDVIFIGPNDLAQSLGHPGETQHPHVLQVLDQILTTVTARRIPLGIMVWNAQAAREWRARGAQFISIGLEAVISPAMREYLAAARAE